MKGEGEEVVGLKEEEFDPRAGEVEHWMQSSMEEAGEDQRAHL